jgi:S-adenosyl-L-methionine hydrolase (adenosine-forming)
MPQHILLMTDFGTRDGYPAAMKGVVWSIAPQAEVSDLTHDIPPQDVLAGALTLNRAAPYFPDGTLFVAVVDPGVGTSRRPLAARLGGQFFTAPDNGLLSLLLARTEQQGLPVEIVHLDRPQFWRQPVSRTFHGRDIFAPAAAHLANGVKITELGTPISDPLRLRLPVPSRTAQGWAGEIIHVDTFGNLATNLDAAHLPATGGVEIRIAGRRIAGVAQSYGDQQPGTLTALIDSAGALSIALVNGSAAQHLSAGVGTAVEVII